MAVSKAALYLIIGALTGSFFAHQYHIAQASKLVEQQRKAWEANNESIKASSDHWQGKLEAANDIKPVTVERVVYLSVPMPAAKCDGVDDGRAAVTYRINGTTVQDIERRTAGAEQQYRECSFRLRAYQNGGK